MSYYLAYSLYCCAVVYILTSVAGADRLTCRTLFPVGIYIACLWLNADVNRFAGDTGDDAVGDDVIRGHVGRGGTPIVRDTATAPLTSNAAQVGDYYDDAWEM